MNRKIQGATLTAGVIASLIASLCCIGPVALTVLGITSVSFFAIFDVYRPVLMALTAIFLTLAFYLTYRKKDEVECKKDKRNKVVLWTTTLLIIGFLTFPHWGFSLLRIF
ncbi:hypothetical protein A9Q84_12450 [Halobacteriovorax marinus]|mgnify:CR=1 FL=1|uniref:Mercuric transport protein MerT n=1 Tax=Halobacteriovorax marinus TaxID=97084 RepID=A0A1Y5FCF1_9BACT|nr:hypothetical protein A9Q84_12450 [Halobacteriovorax marinus]